MSNQTERTDTDGTPGPRGLRSICVFCGSRKGNRAEYPAMAEQLGHLLAERGLQLVYGGGNIGLMGIVADACLNAGGRVVGVIPESLVGREVDGQAVEHSGLNRLEIVASMHARKARMAELADGFIALPGGLGTFEELFEILTWAQLGFHRKPIGLLNVAGYFHPLLALCDRAVSEGFLSKDNYNLLLAHSEPAALLDVLAASQPQSNQAWISQESQL